MTRTEGEETETTVRDERVQEGARYRCPVEGCGCEFTVTSAPEMEATQSFVDCCGHEMEG